MLVEHVKCVVAHNLWLDNPITNAIAQAQFHCDKRVFNLRNDNAWSIVDVGGRINLDLEASHLLGDAGNTPGTCSTFLCMTELTVSLSKTIDNCRLANIRHTPNHQPRSHCLKLRIGFRLDERQKLGDVHVLLC